MHDWSVWERSGVGAAGCSGAAGRSNNLLEIQTYGEISSPSVGEPFGTRECWKLVSTKMLANRRSPWKPLEQDSWGHGLMEDGAYPKRLSLGFVEGTSFGAVQAIVICDLDAGPFQKLQCFGEVAGGSGDWLLLEKPLLTTLPLPPVRRRPRERLGVCRGGVMPQNAGSG